MKNSIDWQIAMNITIEFKLQVTAVPGSHSLFNWCYQMMWLFSDAFENLENNSVMEKYCAKALHLVVKSLMHTIHTIHTKAKEAQKNATHQMIQNETFLTMRRL